jgi:hypothetical protein
MASLESELAPRFGVRDLEIVSGRPRWQADVDVARRRLLERGLVSGGTREGVWVLTTAGVKGAEQLQRDLDSPRGFSGRTSIRRVGQASLAQGTSRSRREPTKPEGSVTAKSHEPSAPREADGGRRVLVRLR